jgi:hypothetical protein
MYQTKPPMSTGAGRQKAQNSADFGSDQVVLTAAAPTSVTCPIFRPGRGGPLP